MTYDKDCPSIFIPHVFPNIAGDDIRNIFESLDIGLVKYIDFVNKMNSSGKEYNMVFVHFHKWFDNKTAHNFKEKVLDPNKKAKLMYDDPWYWIVLPNLDSKQQSVEKTESDNSTDPVSDYMKQVDNYLNQTDEQISSIVKWINYQQLAIKSFDNRLSNIERILDIPPPPPPPPNGKKKRRSRARQSSISTQTGRNSWSD